MNETHDNCQRPELCLLSETCIPCAICPNVRENTDASLTGVEARVAADIAARQRVGILKYGTTVADNPLHLREWLEHAYQEALDLPIYLKRAIEQIDRENAEVSHGDRERQPDAHSTHNQPQNSTARRVSVGMTVLLALFRIMKTTPKTDEKWTHRNGITYTIVGIANDPPTETHPLTVVYVGVNRKLWSRPLADWHRSFSKANA